MKADIQNEFEQLLKDHMHHVIRDRDTFEKGARQAGLHMLYSETPKGETVDLFAPFGCNQSLSNGVVYGACIMQGCIRREAESVK